RIKVRRGFVKLPQPKVVAAYTDPPGERGVFKYDCDLLRSDWTWWDQGALERLKNRLLDEALSTARERYLRDHHEIHQADCEDALEEAIEKAHQGGKGK